MRRASPARECNRQSLYQSKQQLRTQWSEGAMVGARDTSNRNACEGQAAQGEVSRARVPVTACGHASPHFQGRERSRRLFGAFAAPLPSAVALHAGSASASAAGGTAAAIRSVCRLLPVQAPPAIPLHPLHPLLRAFSVAEQRTVSAPRLALPLALSPRFLAFLASSDSSRP